MVTDRIYKEKRVIELYKQNKTIREIAQDVHMSFGDISLMIKKFTGENKNKEKVISKDTQAIKLFSQGKMPVDVVIELDISSDEANRIYRDFWKLKRLYQLYSIYEEIKSDIPSFLKLFKLMKQEGLAEKDILELLGYSNQVSSLGRIVQSLYKKIKVLTHQKDVVSSEYYDIQNELEYSKNLLQQYQSELNDLIYKIKIKSKYLETIENSIYNLINDKGYLKIKETIEKKVTALLDSKQDLIMATIVTALCAIRDDPNKGMLIDYFGHYNYDYFSDTNDNLQQNSQHSFKSYIQTYHQPLLEISDMLYDKILKTIQSQILPPLLLEQ